MGLTAATHPDPGTVPRLSRRRPGRRNQCCRQRDGERAPAAALSSIPALEFIPQAGGSSFSSVCAMLTAFLPQPNSFPKNFRGSRIKCTVCAFDFRFPPFVSTRPPRSASAQASAAAIARWPAVRCRRATLTPTLPARIRAGMRESALLHLLRPPDRRVAALGAQPGFTFEAVGPLPDITHAELVAPELPIMVGDQS